MKYMKQILLIAALMLSIGAVAEDATSRVTVIKQLAGVETTTGGDVSVSVNGTSIELEVTPAAGNYFEATDLTVTKHIDAGNAHARRRSAPVTPDYDETVSVTKTSGDDPSATSAYQFALDSDANILYEVTANFHARTSLTTATVTVATGTYTYDGTEQTPGVTVTLGTTILDGNTDYSVDYANNIAAGPATVTVTGKGKYIGTNGSGTFTIGPKSIADATVTLTPEGFTFTRESQKPAVSVSDGSTPLVEGTDYTLTNAGGTDVGEYSVVVTGKGNYDSQTTAEKKYNITVKTVTPTVTLANPTEALVYDGQEKKPALTVKDGSFVLSATDYDVVYSTNVNAGSLTAKASVTLKGNYAGSGSVDFTIGKAAVTITAKSEEFVYDGAAHSNAGYDVQGLIGSDQVSAVVEGSITFPTEGPVVNRVTGYSFTTGIAGNYEVTTSDGQLTMRNADAAITITAASDSWVYDGESHVNPSVTVTSGSLLSGDKLVAVASGVVTYVGDTEEGNNMIEDGYKVMHGDKDVTSNYVITAVAGTLTITPAHFGLSFPVGTVTKQCDDKPFKVTVTSEMAGKVSYSSSDPAVATVDANGTVTIVRAGKTQITGTMYVDDNHATEQASYWLEVKRIMILEGPGTTVSFDGINYFVEMNEDIAPGQVLPEFICDAHLTYTRMLSTEGRTAVSIDGADRYIFTLCLPFAPRFSAKFYTLTGVNGNTLQFDEIEGKAKAYTPYLVSTPHNVAVRNVEATIIHAVTPEGDEMTIPSLTDEEVDGRQYTSEEDISFCRNMVESAPVSGYQLKGTLRGLTNSDAALEGAYILDNDGTWGVVTAGTQAYIPPFRAYVAAPDGQTLPLNSSFGKDSATGIERIVTIDRDGTEHWYDLNGRRIVNGKTNRGLYIHNGKKIVSK